MSNSGIAFILILYNLLTFAIRIHKKFWFILIFDFILRIVFTCTSAKQAECKLCCYSFLHHGGSVSRGCVSSSIKFGSLYSAVLSFPVLPNCQLPLFITVSHHLPLLALLAASLISSIEEHVSLLSSR